MSVARWLAFVCTVVTLTFSTGCSAILGDFTDTPSDGGSGATTDGNVLPPSGDASGAVDGSQPLQDGNTGPGVDSSTIDSPTGPGVDSGADAAAQCSAGQTTCTLPHAIATCSGGACAIVSCLNGYTDCDGLAADGCEVETGTDPDNCGTCSHKCNSTNGTAICQGGSCTGITCDPGFADCDGIESNGCDTFITTATNCGVCAYVCGAQNGTPSCTTADDAGVAECVYACTPPYAHCPASADKNGCDIDTATDNENCGTCGNVCALGQTCSNGTCACNPSTCKDGCCDPDGGACVTASASACGISGNVCVGCASGQHCDGTTGACVCDPSSCAGCCSGNVCITSPADPDTQCGQGGLACSNCTTDSLACSADLTTCVCTQTSCAGGCCNGNVCVPVGGAQNTSQCGTGGNECGKCAAGQACSGGGCECGGGACNGCCGAGSACIAQDGGSATCGANGGVCAACGANQECNTQGQCVCDANTCPNGCCTATVGGTCITSELPGACGSGGALCAACTSGSQECAQQGAGGPYVCTCDANSCKNGCCTAAINGTCVGYGSETPTECGAAGALCAGCGQGTYCNASGVCTCDSTKCGGCCTSPTGSCLASGVSSCGIKGATCATCTSGQDCNAAGQCQCDGSSCGQGCCTALIGGTCMGGAANPACGVGGAICSVCATGSGTTCNGVSCVCNTSSGCAGCCSSATTCAAGTAFGACGTGGNTCEPCASGQHCGASGATIGECLCDGTSCGSGCCTAVDNGTCVGYGSEQTTQCGYSGAVCAGCPAGQGCNLTTGHCGCTTGATGSCPAGCCDASGNCDTSGPGSCGTLGAACQVCAPGTSCISGECQQLVSVSVSGNGTVSSTTAGISNCATACAAPFNYGTNVTLTQSAGTGSTFSTWTGSCTGSGGCTINDITAPASVTATFTVNQYLVSVTTLGSGSGTIVSTPAGINCGSGGVGTCQASFAYGTALTLTETPGTESNFSTTGWGGSCSTFGTGTTCNLNVTSPLAASGTFTLDQFALSVAAAGLGSGTMTSNQTPNISCAASAGLTSGACSESYNYNESVTVTATPSTGSTATGWTGNTNCSAASATCTLPVTAATNLTATFALKPETLTVTLAGTGAGTVTLTPAGIACGGGGACSAAFPYGTAVTLTPSANTGSSLASWAGGCTPSGANCVATMNGAENVTTTFNLIPETLTIKNLGPGTVNYPGGTCSAPLCTVQINYGTALNLTATPYSTTTFASWTSTVSGCSGAACSFTMTAATTVTATWVVAPAIQPATWDPVWGPTLTYSNGNLSVTSPVGSTTYGTAARSTVGVFTGAVYWEVLVTAGVASVNNGGIGIAGNGYPPTGDYLGEIQASFGIGYGTNTQYWLDWNGTATELTGNASDPIAAGVVYMFAYNASSGDLWVGTNGTWFTGNPATNTSPTETGITPPVYPAVTFYEFAGDTANAFTANFGTQAFDYPVPAGFTAGVFNYFYGNPGLACTTGGESVGYLMGDEITVPAPMVVTALALTMAAAPSMNGIAALYNSAGSGGGPGALLASTPSTAIVNGVNQIPVTPVAIGAGSYWLMAEYSSGISSICVSSATNNEDYASEAFGTVPATAPAMTTASYHPFGYFVVGN